MLPAVALVTLLPKHYQVNLQFKLRYLCPWLPAVTGVIRVPKHSSVNLQFKRGAFVPPCYLRLPMLLCFQNTVKWICNLSWCICVPMLPAATHVTLSPKHISVHLHFMLRYLCSCVTCVYPCYPVTQTHSHVNLQFKWREVRPSVTSDYPCYPVTQIQSC